MSYQSSIIKPRSTLLACSRESTVGFGIFAAARKDIRHFVIDSGKYTEFVITKKRRVHLFVNLMLQSHETRSYESTLTSSNTRSLLTDKSSSSYNDMPHVPLKMN